MNRRILALFVLTPLAPAGAQQATTIPDTVVTATRVPTPQERIPAATTIIDRQEIEERGYVTLADALAAVPGLRVIQAGGPGQQASGFVRGTNSRHVLVLRDGVPLNDSAEPNGAFNFGNELLGDVERIEVVRGPVSAVYGTAAIGGVVNLITRRAPADRSFAPYGEIAGGTQRTLRGYLGAGGTIGAFDYGITGQSLSTEGFNATAPRIWTNRGERDGLRAAAMTARAGVTLGETTPDAILGATRIEGLIRWRENSFGLDDVPQDDPNYSADDRNWFGYLRSETALFGGAWTTGLRLSGSQDRRRYVNLPDNDSPATADDLYRGTRTGLAWDNTVRLPAGGFVTDASITFGGGWEREAAESASGSPFFRTTVDARQESTYGYLGAQARLFERLDVTAALRMDDAEDYGTDTSWRLGAVLALPEISSRLRASAGTAFKAPSLYQRFGVIGSFFRGNPNLEAERSTSWEAGMETDIGRWATISALYFDNRVRDLINFDPTFSTLVNVDRARIRGGEFALTVRPADWLSVTGAWTVTEARDTETDTPLPRRPRNVASLNARIAPEVGWFDVPRSRLVIAPEILYVGASPEGAFARYSDDGQAIPTAGKNPDGWLFNLTASLPVTQQLTAFVEVRNIGNTRYEPANAFVVPGRSAIVGMRGAF
ncbi:TonB-dependent receptor plug domain-containing protein [Neoroseomonas soli]|uniref:TonB-dependent receptor n=1 Tax=Neoroseomonas soli TaxID=1081025 RepID=A0A9X9X4C6_9PROT|nr:TonB-dependent receptor [Neoroseomonas soli]MBR0674255.1 TonB-dependent receptor [Neoroseomonas soli]